MIIGDFAAQDRTDFWRETAHYNLSTISTIHAIKPGEDIDNGSVTTGGDDGEGAAAGRRRSWRTSARQLTMQFSEGA